MPIRRQVIVTDVITRTYAVEVLIPDDIAYRLADYEDDIRPEEYLEDPEWAEREWIEHTLHYGEPQYLNLICELQSTVYEQDWVVASREILDNWGITWDQILEARGWDPHLYYIAMLGNNGSPSAEDQVALLHPTNYATEQEMQEHEDRILEDIKLRVERDTKWQK